MSFLNIKRQIEADVRENVDENANFSPTDINGQTVNINAYYATLLQEAIDTAINNNSIMAEGFYLDIQLAMQGKTRFRGARARIVGLLVTISDDCDILTTDTFQTSTGIQFRPIQEYNLLITDGATQRIDVDAVDIGSYGIITQVNEIVSPVTNLDSVEMDGSSAYVDGRDVETDEQARQRLQQDTNATEYTAFGIKTAVETIDGVQTCYVIPDEINHKIEVVVEYIGDVVDAIARAIAFSKPAGIPARTDSTLKESVLVEVSPKTNILIEFAPAEEIPCQVELVTSPVLTPDQETALTAYIITWSQGLRAGQDLVLLGSNSVVKAILDWTGADIDNLIVRIKKSGGAYGTSNIEITSRQVARINNVEYP